MWVKTEADSGARKSRGNATVKSVKINQGWEKKDKGKKGIFWKKSKRGGGGIGLHKKTNMGEDNSKNRMKYDNGKENKDEIKHNNNVCI